MRWRLLSVLLLSLLILGSLGSASIGRDRNNNDKVCQLVDYWVFENGRWVEKSEPKLWWYCQEPEKSGGFDGFAFKEMPYGLFKKPDVKILHQAARDLTDLVGIDEFHGKFSKNLPSYGGMFINEEKGLIFVYVKDEKDKEKIKQVFGKYKGKANIVFLKSKYSFRQLVRWKEKARELFRIKELEVTWISAENSKNRLIIGLRDVSPEKLTLLSEHLSTLGIPKDAVVVEKLDLKPLNLEKDYRLTQSLPGHGLVRPLMGGIQFQVSGHNYCTLGFPAKRNGIVGMVTAGHCTEEGAQAYQPDASDPSYSIGDVEVKLWSPTRGDMAWIRTTVDVTPKIYPYYIIKGFKASQYQYVGSPVLKSGRTTGLTGGTIAQKGEFEGVNNQVLTTMEVAAGDSGSPTFYWWLGQAYQYAELYGLLWAYDPQTGYSVYNPIDNVMEKLGIIPITG